MTLKLKLIVALFIMFISPCFIMLYTVLIAGNAFGVHQWSVALILLGTGVFSIMGVCIEVH